MGAHSGRFGVVDGQSTVRNWNIADTSAPPRYRASNTAGGSGRRAGVRDWTGSFAAYGGIPLIMPSEKFTFQGYTAPDNDASGGVGTIYSGTAIVDSVVITWNWANGDIIAYTVNFGGDGVLLAEDAQTALTDATTPDVPEVCSAKIQYLADGGDQSSGSGDSWTDWDSLENATLTINADNVSYVNSGTNCWTERTPGPIDWTLAVVEQETQREQIVELQIAKELNLRLFTNGTDYWSLKWGHVMDFSNITVDRESAAIVSQTVNIGMNGFDPDGSGGTGRIRKPGAGSNWWPF